MVDYKPHRYDFYGEFSDEESSPGTYSTGHIKSNQGMKPNGSPIMVPTSDNNNADINNQPGPEDSLMEFINDYFQGNVTQDFSNQSLNGSIENPHAFDYSSSSEMNTSIEMSSSHDNPILNCPNHFEKANNVTDVGSPFLSMPDQPHSPRRDSISYDILFMNSKEEHGNGKVKIHIIPNEKQARDRENKHIATKPLEDVGNCLNRNNAKGWTVEEENFWLRKQVADLERKLHCLETESERVVGELSKILEKKNEVISQLELQVAGIRTKS